MQVMYQSTRGKGEPVTASWAILKGLSEDGGLFVPTSIPSLDVSMEELSRMSYQETAYQVMSRLLTDFTEEELRTCINSAYDKKFDTDVIAPLKEADGAYFLELFHGPTIAFKDMALSILPYLMTTAAKKNNVKNEIVILTATSGDTGKAALAAYPDFTLLDFDGTDGAFEVSDEDINIGVSLKKGNDELKDAINGVLETMTEDDFNEMMDEAISVQPLSSEE